MSVEFDRPWQSSRGHRTCVLVVGVPEDGLSARSIPLPATLVVGSWLLLTVWAAISSATTGCRCGDGVLALGEIGLFGTAAMLLFLAIPTAGRPLLFCAFVGVVLTAILALVDVGTLSGSSGETPGRL